MTDLINNTLQEILTKDSTNHLSILSWKSKKIPNALILKFQGNRYLGLLRKDKKGQEYWKYHLLSRHSDLEQSGPASPVMDNIQKFQERQNQVNNYDNKSDNPVPNNSSQ